jgi:glycosyltransferase involved in cell wall biosynthesis
MMEELLSVVIPTYNRAGTLQNTMLSVLNQSFTNIELIIVDDASTDETEEIVRSIYDDRVKYIKLEINSGPSAARNAGIKAASGSFIAFQDSDDIWLEEKLMKQMARLQSDESLGMVYTGYRLIFDNNSELYMPPAFMDNKLKEGYIFESLLKGNKIGTPTMLIKRIILDEIGGFDIKLKAYEDWDLSIRIAKQYKIGFVNDYMVNAYSHANGVNSNSKNIVDALCYMVIKYKDDYIKYSLMNEKISEILEDCIDFDPSYVDTVKRVLVPRVIEKEEVFDAICYQAMRTCKFKNNYNALVKISETDQLSLKFDELCLKNKWETVAIYGIGNVGKLLLSNLMTSHINIKYLIDKKADAGINSKMNIIRPVDITKDIDVIIITISAEYNSIAKELRKYTNCDIISIQQLFT